VKSTAYICSENTLLLQNWISYQLHFLVNKEFTVKVSLHGVEHRKKGKQHVETVLSRNIEKWNEIIEIGEVKPI